MFIAPLLPQDPRSSGAQCFRAMTAQVEQVSLLWSEENAFAVARSINISSLRDEESAYKGTRRVLTNSR